MQPLTYKSRFSLRPHNSRFGGTVWFIRDADALSDAEIREDASQRDFGPFDTQVAAFNYCERAMRNGFVIGA